MRGPMAIMSYESTFCYILILFYHFLAATSYSEAPESIMYGDTTTDSFRLWQIKDSRDDGISFEADKATLVLHLKDTYHGKKLDDFSLPGRQQLRLDYGDTLESKKSEALLGVLETLELSADGTWEIEISGSRGGFSNRTVLSNVLHRLPAIASVHWSKEEPIPVDTIHFLEERHPFCKLYYELPLYYLESANADPMNDRRIRRSQQPESVEAVASAKHFRASAQESILNSAILHSLKVQVFNGGREREPWKMDLIFRILTTCPNIKELDISVTRGGGCVVFNTDDPYGFDFTSSNATIAPLESLTINGYRFHGKPDGQNWMEWEAEHPKRNVLNLPWKYLPDSIINYVGYPKIRSLGGLQSSFVKRDTSPLKPETKTNLDTWLERMDWTHLHTFKINNPDSCDLKPLEGDTLPRLQKVVFSGYYANHHATVDFLGNISSSLESIQFDGINFCSVDELVDTITEHHGSSLRTFMLKHSRPGHSRYQTHRGDRKTYSFPITSFINVTHLVQLRDKAPALATLDLDVDVRKEWDYELLDTLASFPELEHLTLRFEEQIDDWGGYDEEEYDLYSLNSEYRSNEYELMLMIGLKAYLRKQKVGTPFKRVDTWVGLELMKDIAELC